MANKLLSSDIARIGIQSEIESIPLDTNYQNIKNKVNELIDELNAVSIGTTNAETTAARPYHASLNDRLNSMWFGQPNYIKSGGVVTINSDLQAEVTAGQGRVDGVDVVWSFATSGAISLTSSDTRFDVVLLNSDSTITIGTGTESADPVYPTVTSSQKVLALLTVTTSDVTATDARDWGVYYRKDGRMRYEWTAQNAIDDLDDTVGGSLVFVGDFYEELDTSGKSNIFLDGYNATLYRRSDSHACIKCVNSVGNESENCQWVGFDCRGNSKAGTLPLIELDYVEKFILRDCVGDGNSSSSATGRDIETVACLDFETIGCNFISTNYAEAIVFSDLSASQNINAYGPKSITEVGNQEVTNMGNPAVTALTTSRIAFFDSINDDLRAYDFNGSTWSQTGSDLNISGAGTPALAAMSSSRVAFFDANSDDLRAYDFNGSTWSQTGSDLNIPSIGSPALTALSSSRVVLTDDSNEEILVYDFNGSTWAQVGTGFEVPGAEGQRAITALSERHIAHLPANDDLRVYEFNGTTWAQVGSGINVGVTSLDRISISAISSSHVVFLDNDNEELRVYGFSGTAWQQIGPSLSVSNDTPALATFSNRTGLVQVALADGGANNNLATYDITYGFNSIPNPALLV
jgi:hypothetical protein